MKSVCENRGRLRRVALLASCYLVQDIGFSFFFLALVVILRQRGASLEQLALVNLAGFAWAGKFLLGPVVDRWSVRRFGHYRGWLLLTQALMVLALLCLLPLDPVGDLPLVLGVMVVMLIVAGAHDVATNGLAVRLLTPEERGTGSGLQIAAISLSIILGSSGTLLLYAHVGWEAALGVLAAVTALPLVFLLRFREPPGPSASGPASRALLSLVRRPGIARWMLAVVPLYLLGVYSAEALVPAMLVDARWSTSRIAIVQGTLGGLASALAALGTGVLLRRVSRRRALRTFGFVQALLLLFLLPVATGHAGNGFGATVTTLAVILLWAANAAALSTIYSCAMDLARPATAATDLAVQLAVVGVVRLVANASGPALAGQAGYPPLILAGAALTLLGTVAATRWARHHHPHATALHVVAA